MNALTLRDAQLAYDRMSPPEDDDRQNRWLDSLDDETFGAYAREWLDLARSDAHMQAFLEFTQKAFARDCAIAGEP